MKHYEITIDGRTFDVNVLGDPTLDRVEVEVDGEVLAVEVRHGERPAMVASPAATTQPRRQASAAPRVPAAVAAPASSGGNSVRAPLPGVVKRVAVEAGQQVAPGELLVVIEAMKMDNAIRATRDGVIEAVHAVEGRQVAHGDDLLHFRS